MSKGMTVKQAKRLWCEVSGRKRYEKGGTTSEDARGNVFAYDSAMRLIGSRMKA